MYLCSQLQCKKNHLQLRVAIVIVILSGLLATRIGSEFVPSLNEGDIALHAITNSWNKSDNSN